MPALSDNPREIQWAAEFFSHSARDLRTEPPSRLDPVRRLAPAKDAMSSIFVLLNFALVVHNWPTTRFKS